LDGLEQAALVIDQEHDGVARIDDGAPAVEVQWIHRDLLLGAIKESKSNASANRWIPKARGDHCRCRQAAIWRPLARAPYRAGLNRRMFSSSEVPSPTRDMNVPAPCDTKTCSGPR